MKKPFCANALSRAAFAVRRGRFTRIGIPALAVVALAQLAGCRSATAPDHLPPPAVQAPGEAGKAEFAAVAQAYGKELLDAVGEQDYRKFVTHFAAAFDTKEREKGFPASCSKIGKIIKSEYIGNLDRELLQTYLWRVAVEKAVKEKNGEARTATFDRLMQITLLKADGKFQIVDFQFN